MHGFNILSGVSRKIVAIFTTHLTESQKFAILITATTYAGAAIGGAFGGAVLAATGNSGAAELVSNVASTLTTMGLESAFGGANVYIRKITSNRHNVLIENIDGEIITYIPNVDKHGLKI